MSVLFSLALSVVSLHGAAALGQEVYLWVEAEWFDGVVGVTSAAAPAQDAPQGWTYRAHEALPPLVELEASAGAAIAADPATSQARASYRLEVPRSDTYTVWCRYAQRRDRRAPIALRIEQDGQTVLSHRYDTQAIVSRHDELMLRWGWSYVWEEAAVELADGPATITLGADVEGPREVDCVLLSTNPDYRPVGLEPPPFDYLSHLDALDARGTPLAPLVAPAVQNLAHEAEAPGPVLPRHSEQPMQVPFLDIDPTTACLGVRTALVRGAARQSESIFRSILSAKLPSQRLEGVAPEKPVPLAWLRTTLLHQRLSGACLTQLEPPLSESSRETPAQDARVNETAARFAEFTEKHPDCGVPYTPLAVLVSLADVREAQRPSDLCPFASPHRPTDSERMATAALNALFHPMARLAAEPPLAQRRAFVPTRTGDLCDLIDVSAPPRRDLAEYRVVVTAGDAGPDIEWAEKLIAFVGDGGVLVLNVAQIAELFPKEILGVARLGRTLTSSLAKCELDREALPSAPFRYEQVLAQGARVLASSLSGDPLITCNSVGRGKLILVLIPHGIGLDGQCSPLFAHLLRHLTSGLLPLEVVRGETEWMVNRTARGWLVAVFDNRLPPVRSATGPGATQENQVEIVSKVHVAASTNWLDGRTLNWQQQKDGTGRLALELPAGGIAVIEVIQYPEEGS